MYVCDCREIERGCVCKEIERVYVQRGVYVEIERERERVCVYVQR